MGKRECQEQHARQGRAVADVTRFNREERKARTILCFWLLGGFFLSACAGTPTPVDTVTDQLARGAPLYAQNCATANCHGTKGEGIRAGDSFSAWPLVGKEFAARNPTAQVVFDVVRSGGEQNLRALTDQQIYDAIAFELREHSTRLMAPLTASNATVRTGSDSFNPTVIYPPLNNVSYITPTMPSRAFWSAENDYIELRVDQLALASAIGDVTPPPGSAFAIIVFATRNLTNHALDIEPRYLQLFDSQNNRAEPQVINLFSAYEQFHPITIDPDHGTASIAVFILSPGATWVQLVYDDQTGHVLTVELK